MTEIRETTPESSDPASGSEVVARIEGVRPCLHCGHDLHGQPIRKEKSLGLLISFCPECGQAASMVEHPRLGIWGRRLGILALICMIVMAILFLFVTALSLSGMAIGLTEELGQSPRSALSAMNDGQWQIESGWWRINAPEARATMWAAIDYGDSTFRSLALMFLVVCFMFGVIWSGILLGMRRRYLPLAGITIGVLAWLIVLALLLADGAFDLVGTINTQRVMRRELFPTLSFMVISGLLIPLAVGLVFGRPILRAVVTVVLPPRSRSMLRLLWDIDGVKVSTRFD